MILKGTLNRVGSGTVNLNTRTSSIDALDVGDYPEVRNLRGVSYLTDHVRDAVGQEVVIGISGKSIVAIKKNGKLYQDTGIKTSVNAHLLLWVILGIFFFPIGLIPAYVIAKIKINSVIKEMAQA